MITIDDIAREIEPDAWKAYDEAPTKKGKKQLANMDIWAIESSNEAAERVAKMLKDRGVKQPEGMDNEQS